MTVRVRSAQKALAFAALTEQRPDLSPGQATLLVDVATMLVEDDERPAAVDLLAIALPDDRDAPRRIVDLLLGVVL